MRDHTSSGLDVVILGGGQAGLTLALQLAHERPGTRVLVLERDVHPPPVAAHKVGESLVELGSHYLREHLGLGHYLDAEQLPKLGLRFFLTPSSRDDITGRVEIGPRGALPVPSHQVDRGLLETELGKRVREAGVGFRDGARVREVALDASAGHRVTFEDRDGPRTVSARWVVDASGRAGLLKRQLGLAQPSPHQADAVWFRVDAAIDVQAWSQDPAWRARVPDGRRRLSTNHLMGPGYWVWLIPLVSGSTSVGIVTDPRQHPSGRIRSVEDAVAWLQEHEPQAARFIAPLRDRVQDFGALRGYSYLCARHFSAERWAIVGEAGSFLDPFYSPGADFIAMANTYASDLIARDLEGERVASRADIYEQAFAETVRQWTPVFQDQYTVFGHTQALSCKIAWDFATYWAFQVSTFANRGFTDLERLLGTRPLWQRLAALNRNMARAFLEWAALEPGPEAVEPGFVDPLDLGFLELFHRQMLERLDGPALARRLDENLALLERVAAAILRRAAMHLRGTPATLTVNPYTLSLRELDGAAEPPPPGPGERLVGADAIVAADIERIWFTAAPRAANLPARPRRRTTRADSRDVAVIGAGPAGVVAGLLLHRAGHDVTVFERGTFPRFVIGESLLPRCMDVLQEVGLLERVQRQGYLRKDGATFIRGHQHCSFDFAEQFTEGAWDHTYQVPRAHFDLVLADEARSQGLPIHFRHTVTGAEVGTRPRLELTDAEGRSHEIEARFIVDASGYGRVLPRLFGLNRPSTLPLRTSLFTHVVGDRRPPGTHGARIWITMHEGGWIWLIPFADGRTSVGVVCRPEAIDDLPDDPDARLRAVIEANPVVRERVAGTHFTMPTTEVRGYSVGISQLTGEGYCLVGNATEFLDPVFSSGVTLAFESASRAAAVVDRQLRGQDVDWDAEYTRPLLGGVEAFRAYIDAWYDGTLPAIIFDTPDRPDSVSRMICSIFAGYAWDPSNPFVHSARRKIAQLARLRTAL